jgi:hypothetical protein
MLLQRCHTETLGAAIAVLLRSTNESVFSRTYGLLFDFATDKVIIYTAIEHKNS